MVKVAICGATGGVAQEVLDALVAAQKHEILLLSRSAFPADGLTPGVTSVQTDYQDVDKLVETLQGVHTVLCFLTPQSDTGNVNQKNIIDASIKAGVKRYAPSEWASSTFTHMPWYSGKAEIREYLATLNKDEKVLDYCLFLPGLFVNYFAAPHKTSKHVHPFQLQWDFDGRRAIVMEGTDGGKISLLTVQDFAETIARAVAYEGEWPLVGGISGDVLTVEQLIALGEKIRGPFKIEKQPVEVLERHEVNASWLPLIDHPAIPPEERSQLAAGMTSGMLRAINAGAFHSTNEWNQLLPDVKFTSAEEFLIKAWEGKP